MDCDHDRRSNCGQTSDDHIFVLRKFLV